MIRIGTRDSRLALWQAETVQHQLRKNGYDSVLIPVKSEGDLDLVTPLYAMGVQGVFTRSLDAALLSNNIDIAVHSMKDVPTQLAEGIAEAAVLARGDVHDILIRKQNNNSSLHDAVIATSSVRRKAQWLHRYPQASFAVLRGNMQTRLDKLQLSDWQGAIFAKAGLQRIGLLPENYEELNWMLPAPAQGAIMVVCRQSDKEMLTVCNPLNHLETASCVHAERSFLSHLMGGCSTPVSAHATIVEDHLVFKGNVTSPDGDRSLTIEEVFEAHQFETAGEIAADIIKQKGALSLLLKKDDECV